VHQKNEGKIKIHLFYSHFSNKNDSQIRHNNSVRYKHCFNKSLPEDTFLSGMSELTRPRSIHNPQLMDNIKYCIMLYVGMVFTKSEYKILYHIVS
jgi:transposase